MPTPWLDGKHVVFGEVMPCLRWARRLTACQATATAQGWVCMPSYFGSQASGSAMQVVDGFDVVSKIENTRTGPMDRPQQRVSIAKSGEL